MTVCDKTTTHWATLTTKTTTMAKPYPFSRLRDVLFYEAIYVRSFFFFCFSIALSTIRFSNLLKFGSCKIYTYNAMHVIYNHVFNNFVHEKENVFYSVIVFVIEIFVYPSVCLCVGHAKKFSFMLIVEFFPSDN